MAADDNPLRRLEALGQSIWLDAFRRAMLTSGELKRLIDEDGLSGVTANPAILEKAIAGSHDYDAAVRTLVQQRKRPREIYEALAVEDLRNAADLFRPIYDRTGGQDGFVSLEVSPGVALDAQAPLEEARRLWQALDRPNVMIKVPATAEGIPAIQQLISEGINVNITLLFGLERYRQVIEAYLSGLEARVKSGQDVRGIASVASFFLSRIDVLLDPRLPSDLKGQVAIASARAAYAIYQDVFSSERFAKLGANKQRLLWASTSTKDPAESDVKYVEPLIGPDTINTVPLSTLQAYRDHGNPAPRLAQNVAEAQEVLASVTRLGVDLNEAARHLEED